MNCFNVYFFVAKLDIKKICDLFVIISRNKGLQPYVMQCHDEKPVVYV